MKVEIVAEGLERFKKYFEGAPEAANRAAVLAINRVAERDAMKLLRQGIEQEIAFPDDYVAPRITIRRKAYNSRLEAVLAARHRPTSLARFARGQTPRVGKGAGRPQGVTITVKPGNQKTLKNAFLRRLKAGQGPVSDENFNVGLAIRLKPGEKIHNKNIMAQNFGGGLYLLYGPSVNQVMRNVADDKSPLILEAVENEFLRQFNRIA